MNSQSAEYLFSLFISSANPLKKESFNSNSFKSERRSGMYLPKHLEADIALFNII